MESRISRSLLRILTAIALISFVGSGAAAQNDPDPNSPTPILLSEIGSTRALAVSEDILGRVDISRTPSRAFQPGSTIVLFVRNLSLMPGEGANAFRTYIETADGRKYRFPVLDIRPYSVPNGQKGVYALTVRLSDEIGYWEPPTTDGDLLVGVTWRGLISNRVRLGYGQMGGRIKDDPGAVPTPLGTAVARNSPNNGLSPEYVGYKWSGDRMRFLEQAAFGPTAVLDSRIRRIGLKTWLAEQFEAPYPSVAFPYPNQPLKPANQGQDPLCDGGADDVPVTCIRDTYSMYPIQKWFMQEAFYGDAQLRHRVAWALSQIWVTSGVDIQQSRHMVEYHKVLSANAFGNYRNLMEQMTVHPTMGTYLSMASSTKNNPNENYAREIMQLFTVGLFLLNQDGTVKCIEHNPCEPGDTQAPTYDQNGVNNLTKLLTGWQLCNSALNPCPNFAQGTLDYIDPMAITFPNNNFANNLHDLTAKTLLSWPADPAFPPNNTDVLACANCTTGNSATNMANTRIYAEASLDQAMDNLFHHPNVGPFVSKIMIQHMVTSDPSPAYVGRVAAAFNNNGLGIRGDMKAVVRAILLDPEARGDVKTDPNFGKLREPVQFTTNFLRLLNVRSANGLSQSDGVVFERGEFLGMSQVPFRSPTVFNYFPPDFGIPGTTLLGPEFALMTTGTAIQRQNFVNRMVYSSCTDITTCPPIPGGTTNAPNGTSLDWTDLQALATTDTTGNLLMDELNRRMMHSTMSAQMRSTILTAVTSIPATTALNFRLRAQMAVHLITSSSQYQVQR